MFAISVATAQTIEVKPSEGDKVSVNFKDVPVKEAIEAMFRLRPTANKIVNPGVTGRVNLTLSDVEWETALKYVVEQIYAVFRKDDNGVYIIEHNPRIPWISLRDPVAVPIKQGETQYYLIDGHSFWGSRYLTITLHCLEGDADLFVGFDKDISPNNYVFKSSNGPLQTDQIVYDDSQTKRPIYVAVYGVIDSEYVISIKGTATDAATTPTRPQVLRVTSQVITGSTWLIVTGLTIENLTGAWYEVTVTKEGKVLEKSAIPQHFILGPKQRRYYGYVALDDKSKLTFSLHRNTPKARAYLVADLVVRLVNNGKPMSPDIGDAVEDLIPRLYALAPAAIKFQRGDWRGGGEELLRVLKQRSDVLSALQQVVNRSGINITRVLLTSKIGAGFGALSASMQAITASKAPAEERVEVKLGEIGKLGN